MKKVLLVFTIVLISSAAYCQMQAGIKAGYSWFKILQTDKDYHPATISYDNNSFPISAFFCQRSPHLINFHLEIEYMKRSYSVHEYWGGLGSRGEANYKIIANYLSILVDPQFVFGKNVKYYIFPGIYIGIPVYSSADGTGYEPGHPYPNTNYFTISGNALEYIQDVELGALAGVGIDIPVYQELKITLQYIFSISLIPLESKWQENSFRFMQNKIELGIAYQFNCKKKKEKED
jgi:hypothetical protein